MKRLRTKRRRQVIERRMTHLSERIAKTHNEYDSAEFSALRWALEQVDEAEKLRADIVILEAKEKDAFERGRAAAFAEASQQLQTAFPEKFQ